MVGVPFRKCTSNTPSPHLIALVILCSKFIAISRESNKAHLKSFVRGRVKKNQIIITLIGSSYQMFYRYAVYLVLKLVDRENIHLQSKLYSYKSLMVDISF